MTSFPKTSLIPSYQHIPYLDGLRGLSVLLVMISHIGLGDKVPGGLGVTTFFFISGFLITRLMLAEVSQSPDNKFSIVQFYIRRSFRILPAMLFFVIVSTALTYFMALPVNLIELVPAFTFTENYFLTLRPEYHATLSQFGILWSLAVEEHFYLAFPWLLAVVLWRKRLTELALYLTLFLVVCLGWRILLGQIIHPFEVYNAYSYMATDTRIDSILYGVLLSILCFLPAGQRLVNKLKQNWLFYVGMALLLATLLIRDPMLRATWRYTLQGIALFISFIPLLFNDSGFPLARRFLEVPVLRWVGKISFSLYLWHCFIFVVLEQFLKQTHLLSHNTIEGKLFLFFATIVLSLGVAQLSYKYIEQPFLSLRKILFKPHTPTVSQAITPETLLENPRETLVTSGLHFAPEGLKGLPLAFKQLFSFWPVFF